MSRFGKSAIHEMTRLSKEIDDVAFLSWAKPTSDTPEHVKEGAIRAIRDGLTAGYSETLGLPALREAIVAKLARDNGVRATPGEIIVTVGAIEGLSAAVMAVVDPGDEVILPTPTYSTHIRQVELAGGKPVLVPLIEADGFRWDIAATRAAVTPRTRAILYCTPSNPTGTVFDEATQLALGALARQHGLMVITDEAYEYFVYDDHRHFSLASVPDLRENVIGCYTFTKTYAMTGYRVGYVHAAPDVIAHIAKVHIPFAICAPVVSQYAALAALAGDQACVADFRAHYLAMRNLMCERLDRLDHVFEYARPGGSYLMFPKIVRDGGKTDSKTFCLDLLREARVSATPGVAFGPTGESHLRLSFCVPESEIHKAFDRMEAYFSAGSPRGR
ncbi:MAG: aminotransferase class I/II-fold pyridoxal phosphate-dependent enzyme [Candidatus Krumholzibacteriota bacterium]|nr:aminotransferase class I/II-fold pyridoxal phosphate-dependent enzyme [Candidatus Krumholzibacteriota bacterium]